MATQVGQIAEVVEASEKIDLREMNEEEFIELFEYIREQTNDFKKLQPEVLLEDSRRLLILRLCFGLSQKEFGRALGRTKDWVRHTEAGKNKILHRKIVGRYVEKLEALMNQKEVNVQRALANFNRYRFFAENQNLPGPQAKFKPILEMSGNDFREYFSLVSKATEGFTKFPPDFLVRVPQSILIFRIILGIGHRNFAALLGIDSRWLRSYEHLKARIKPRTAAKHMERIDQLFKGFKVEFTDALLNLYRFKNIFQKRELSGCIEQGLRLAKVIPPNDLEKKVGDLLKRAEIPIEFHARVRGIKKDYNVDFAVPNSQDPKIIVEVTGPTLLRRKKKNYRSLICLLDHKFQMIKARYPSLLTVMVLIPNGIPTDMQRMRKMVQAETLNTDMYAIEEEELKNVITKIKEYLKT